MMIAKRQPERKRTKSSFKLLTDYILRSNQFAEKEKIVGYRISNCQFNNAIDLAMDEILMTQRQNKRSNADPCYHLVFSFPPGEKPKGDILADIEHELCKSIGLGDHQRISAIHDDTDNYHVHVAINKVHPVTHNMVEPYRDKIKLIETAEQLEIKHGLVKQVDWEAARQKRRRGERDKPNPPAETLKAHTHQIPFDAWVKQHRAEITALIDPAPDWKTCQANLARLDLQIRPRGNGMVLSSRSEKAFAKLSTLGREYSAGKLEKRLGRFQAAEKPAAAPEKQYVKGPRQPADNRLWEAFQADQQQKKNRMAVLKRATANQKAEQLTDYQQRRLAIRVNPLLSGPNKREAYQRLKKNHQQRLRAISTAAAGERQQITRDHPARNWQTYLVAQAIQGDSAALKALRHPETRKQVLARHALSGPVAEQVNALLTGLKPAIRTNGTVSYSVGKARILDTGNRLQTDTNDPTAITAMLRLARHQFGDQGLVIQGSAAFRQQVITAAATENMPVTFADPAMEQQRQQLQAALHPSAPASPRQPGRQHPPPQHQDTER
ncbi:MAG: relaxase/mobilization nuclease domain-containing protein [Thiothrix sp.]|nr:relaxase/mobilization nuclease domain-containing protein [Thiothrix sp.]